MITASKNQVPCSYGHLNIVLRRTWKLRDCPLIFKWFWKGFQEHVIAQLKLKHLPNHKALILQHYSMIHTHLNAYTLNALPVRSDTIFQYSWMHICLFLTGVQLFNRETLADDMIMNCLWLGFLLKSPLWDSVCIWMYSVVVCVCVCTVGGLRSRPLIRCSLDSLQELIYSSPKVGDALKSNVLRIRCARARLCVMY